MYLEKPLLNREVKPLWQKTPTFELYLKLKGKEMAANYRSIEVSIDMLTKYPKSFISDDKEGSISFYFFNDVEIIRISNHWVRNSTRVVLLNGLEYGHRGGDCYYVGRITRPEAARGYIVPLDEIKKFRGEEVRLFKTELSSEFIEQVKELVLSKK